MAGIIVSGGIYSGSGDVTADWFYQHYNIGGGSSRVYLPDGTMTLTSETGNSAFRNDWMGSSDYFQHQNGTVKITHAGGTTLHMIGAGPVASGRSGQLYDVIVNQNSNPRAMDAVLINTVASDGFYAGIQNSLTIISGTARIGNTTATNYTKIGHVYIGASGTFSAGNVATVNNGGYNNWDSSGSISVKSVLFNGTNGVFVANSGTIQVLGPYSGNGSDHFVWDNNSKGTVYHNSGTIQFGGVGLLSIGQSSENATYNNYRNNNRAADGTGQSSNGDGGYLYNMSVGFRDGDSPTRHLGLQAVSNILVGNDLTVLTSGGIDKSTYSSTIIGSVELKGDAYWGNYAAQGGTNTWGRLYMAEGSSFKAPTGTLVLNKNIGGYTMYNPEGTFKHNSGTVAINFTGTDATQVRNQSYFYNYEQTLDTGAYASARVNWRGDGSSPYAFRIANNATIKEGSFRPTAPANTMVISGALEIQSGGTYGYSAGDFEVSSSIGSVDIQSGGKMYASTDLTTITAGNFTDAGTFYHNSGAFSVKAGHSALILGASNTAFYDIKSASEGSGVSTFRQYTDCIVEHDMITGSKELQWQLTTNDVKLTLGTTSYASQVNPDYFDGAVVANQYVYSASELFPAVFKSSIQILRYMGSPGQAGYMSTNAHIKWLDIQKDIITPGGTKTLTLDGESKFVDFTLTNTDTLHASGTRIETDSLLLDGVFVGSGSLIVANDKLKTNSNSTIYNSGTAAIIGHGGTSTVRFNRGTWETVMFRNTGEVQFDTNTNTAVNFIAAGGIVNTAGMHFNGDISNTIIANGGTLTHTAGSGIFKTTDFSNRGGLFTSSSAVDANGWSGDFSTVGTMSLFTDDLTLEVWDQHGDLGSSLREIMKHDTLEWLCFKKTNGTHELQFSVVEGAGTLTLGLENAANYFTSGK